MKSSDSVSYREGSFRTVMMRISARIERRKVNNVALDFGECQFVTNQFGLPLGVKFDSCQHVSFPIFSFSAFSFLPLTLLSPLFFLLPPPIDGADPSAFVVENTIPVTSCYCAIVLATLTSGWSTGRHFPPACVIDPSANFESALHL